MSRMLTSELLASRRTFDWRVIRRMSAGQYHFSAHRTPQEARSGGNPIVTETDARWAMHYRARFDIKTLVGPGQYSNSTVMHVDASHPA